MNQLKKSNSSFFSFLPYLILFASVFIFFSFFADYAAYYQEKLTLFVFSGDYLAGHLNQPGSLLVYISDFLTSFYYYPAAGAAIVGIVICLLVFLTSKITGILTGSDSIVIPLFFSAAIFYFHTNYQYLLYNSLGLLIQLAAFYLAIRYLKGWPSVIIFPVLFWITGGFSSIFILMYSLHFSISSLKKGWYKILLLWLTAFLILFILKEYVLFRSAETLLTFPFTDAGTGFQSPSFLAFAGLIIILPLISRIRINAFKRFKIKGIIGKLIPSVVLLMAIITISILRFDNKTRQYFIVEKLFCQGKYDEVIDFNKKNQSNNILTIYLNNIALCETGRLNDQLFQFRQNPEGQTLFLKWEMSGEILRRGGYFYYAIGMVNEAHRWAYENMIMKGITPDDLRMLIKTEIINGNYEIAEKYTSILRRTLFHRREARAYDGFLFNDEAVDSDPLLGAKRREKIRTDFFSITDDPYINIERILASDSLNRKAYEYKLAFMLLKKDYPGIAAQLEGLGKYGFTKIPVHIQEAAEAYKTLNLGPLPNEGTLRPDPRTAQRFNQFLQIFQQYGNNLKSAEPALRQKFGNTFWYYAFYR